MVGIYLSGTGNTKHCLQRLLWIIDPEAELIPIENDSAVEKILKNDEIFLAYPTMFSNIPYMVRDFINKNSSIWDGKKVFCLTTMGLFSGDGTGCAARLLRKFGAKITGGLILKMPDSIGDNKMLKKDAEGNRKIISETDSRIDKVGKDIVENGKYPKEGLSFPSHAAGLLGQRLWFYGKANKYYTKIKISDECIGCGLCVRECPMKNLSIRDGKAVSDGRCTMCYRCFSECPKQAITILGKRVYTQYRFKDNQTTD